MNICGWKTVSCEAQHRGYLYNSEQVQASKSKRGERYADASELPLSPEAEKYFAVCARKGRGNLEEASMRPLCPGPELN